MQVENISLAIGIGTFAFVIALVIFQRLTNRSRVPARLRALSVLIICYGFAISYAGIAIYAPYSDRQVLRASKYTSDKLIPLTDSGAIFTLVFNIGLVAMLLVVGTYLCIYIWRNTTPKP